jgi:hypothetical protein
MEVVRLRARDTLVRKKGGGKGTEDALYKEVRSIGDCEDYARPWRPLPRRSMQDRSPPGKAWITPIFAGLLLGRHDACPWRFAAAPAPSPPFLGKNCKIARQNPMRHPLLLRYCLNIRKMRHWKIENDVHVNFVLESGCPYAVVDVLFVRSYIQAPVCRRAGLVDARRIQVDFSLCQ